MNWPNFIVVDGLDGSGKTTVIEYLRKKLIGLSKGTIPISSARGIGSGNLGIILREFLLTPDKKHPLIEVSAFALAINDCYDNVIKPTLELNGTIILDRYTSSFYAYQVHARELEEAKNMFFNYFNKFKTAPDLYIYCDVDIDISNERLKERSSKISSDYFDEENRNFKTKVIDGYNIIYNNNLISKNKVKLNCNLPLEDVFKQVDDLVEKYFNYEQTKN